MSNFNPTTNTYERPPEVQSNLLDRLKGMLWGCALGDALGVPYEFAYGRIRYDHFITTANNGMPLGSISDDTEMMITLASSIVANQKLDLHHLVTEYCRWASSNVPDLGINIRNLFNRQPSNRCVQEFQASWQQSFDPKNESSWTQSNGCLMRAMPLVVLPEEDWYKDCGLSNPHPTCMDAHHIYLTMMSHTLQQRSVEHPLTVEWATTDDCKAVISQVLSNQPRDLSQNRGWVLNALWCACFTYHNLQQLTKTTDPFVTLFNIIIGSNLQGDTDTNACIAGALLGCAVGFAKMQQLLYTSKNIATIRQGAQESVRPAAYRASKLDDLANGLNSIYEQKQSINTC